MKVVYADEFIKRYRGLTPSLQKKAEKQEKIFKENAFYPSLHTEKLEPRNRGLWSIRIDKKYRIVFRFIGTDTVAFLTVGPHDWIYKILQSL